MLDILYYEQIMQISFVKSRQNDYTSKQARKEHDVIDINYK